MRREGSGPGRAAARRLQRRPAARPGPQDIRAARPGPARSPPVRPGPARARGPRGPARGPRGSLPAGLLHRRECVLLASYLALYAPKHPYMAKYGPYNGILLGGG